MMLGITQHVKKELDWHSARVHHLTTSHFLQREALAPLDHWAQAQKGRGLAPGLELKGDWERRTVYHSAHS